jgi:hypothetical protein
VRRAAVLLLLVPSACGFRSPAAGEPGEPDASTDAAGDGPAALPPCKADPSLLVCFSFDADPLPASLRNEGTASVAAALASITRIPQGPGGAVLLGTASQMRVPPNAVTMGFASVEAWVRVDADPPASGRVGIVDADATSSAVSFFYYAGATSRQVRFEIGVQLYVDVVLPLGTWHYLAEVCDAGKLTAYVDGVKVGEQTGCTPGNATTYGLQIGQNNTQNSSGDEWLVGAIDGLRMWTAPLSAAAICQTAGRSGC